MNRAKVNLDEMSLGEQCCFLSKLCCQSEENQQHIELVLTFMTVLNSTIEIVNEYGFLYIDPIEFVTWLLIALNGCDEQEDQKAWSLVIETLGAEKTFDIIINPHMYV